MRIKPEKLSLIENILSNRKPKHMGDSEKFSVLVPLLNLNGELHLLFQVRAKNLNNFPGEISFPGGALENNESFREACIRETCEELNIGENKIKIFGEIDYIITHHKTILKPFVGLLEHRNPEKLDFNKDEVEQIFTVPLNYFIDNSPELHNVLLEPKFSDDFPFHRIPKGKDYPFQTGDFPVYFYQYGEYNIWGMTARIVNNFVQILSTNKYR